MRRGELGAMTKAELKQELLKRTRRFAARIFKLVDRLPRTTGSIVVINQLLRASASVASNYRSVNRAKSKRDFCNKLRIVLEESDECDFWLTFLVDIGVMKADDPELNFLVKEANEFIAIFTAAAKTASGQ